MKMTCQALHAFCILPLASNLCIIWLIRSCTRSMLWLTFASVWRKELHCLITLFSRVRHIVAALEVWRYGKGIFRSGSLSKLTLYICVRSLVSLGLHFGIHRIEVSRCVIQVLVHSDRNCLWVKRTARACHWLTLIVSRNSIELSAAVSCRWASWLSGYRRSPL